MARPPAIRPLSVWPQIRTWRAPGLDRNEDLATSASLACSVFGSAGTSQPLGALTRAIRDERIKAALGRAGYDVARHRALARAWRRLAKSQGAPRS